MRTHLVTIVVSFDITCNADNTLADEIYHELGYDVNSYANLVKEELINNFVFDVSEPVIKEITGG